MAKRKPLDADTKKFRKWLRQCETGIAKEVKQCLEKTTIKCYNRAKELAPVRTGKLYSSIYWEMISGGTVGKVATNVPYARYVEQGTMYQPPKHFMRNAWYEAKLNFPSELNDVLVAFLNDRPY